jgi:hypothetical protein
LIRTFDAVPSLCPVCSYFVNAATTVTGVTRPAPGDFTVCWGCGTVLRFDSRLRPVQLTNADWMDVDFDRATLILGLQKSILRAAKRDRQVNQKRN